MQPALLVPKSGDEILIQGAAWEHIYLTVKRL